MRRKRFAVAALLLAVVFGLAGQINKPALIVRANVEGADISLNGIPLGKTTPNFAILLDPGTYGLKVSKSGFTEFSTLVTLPPDSLIVDVRLTAIAAANPSPPPALPPAPLPPSTIAIVQPPSGTGGYDIKTVRQGGTDVLRSMALGPNKLVAVGNGMLSAYSSEGQRWLNAPKLPVSGNFTSVRWVKDRYLASGDYGLLYSSGDGITWTKQNSGSTKHLGPSVWVGGRFIMVGQSGAILASSDGIKWSPLQVMISSNLLNIAANGSTIVVTGTSGFIGYSSDAGVVWNKASSGITDNVYGLGVGGPGFVAGGSGQNAPILYSKDGKTWSVVYKSKAPQTFGAVFWDGEKYLVGGSNGAILTSSDGQNWKELPDLSNGKHAVAFASIANTLVLAQHDGTILNLTWNSSVAASPSSGGAPPPPAPPAPKPNAVASQYKTVVLLNEDFESNGPMGQLPTGWMSRDNKNPSYPWAWGTDQDSRNSHSGNWFVSMTFGTSKALVTPPLQLAEGGNATLGFWARNRDPRIPTNLTILMSYGGTSQDDFKFELGRIRGVPDKYQYFSYPIGPEHSGKTLRLMFLGDEPEEGQIIHIDDIQVQARIPEGQAPVAAKTTTLLEENFENKAPPGILPPGWLSRDNANPTYPFAWECAIDNRNAHSGIQFTLASGIDKGLITPPVNIPSGKSAVVTFWIRNRDPKNGGTLEVRLSQGGTEQRDFSDQLGRIERAPDSYQQYSFEIGGLYSGREVRVMFYAAGSNIGQILQIDDVSISVK